VLRRAALHALRLEIPEEARRALAPRRAQRGVLLGEAVVIEQAADVSRSSAASTGGRRVLLLHEAPLQIQPGVRPARERPQGRSLGGLHIGKLAQPVQYRGRELRPGWRLSGSSASSGREANRPRSTSTSR